MNKDIKYIENADRKYPYIINLNVVELIQEKYGSLDKWADSIEGITRNEEGESISKSMPKISDIKWLFKEMINEAIDILNEEKNENKPFVTEKQVGRIINGVGIEKATELITDISTDSFLTDSQIEERKNV